MSKGLERLVTFLVVGVVVTATVPSSAIASGDPRAGITAVGSVPEASIVQSGDVARGAALAAQESAEQEITECTTIDSPGRYVLAEDINRSVPPDEQGTCIEITSSDVVFDGSGGEIEGRIDFDAFGAWRVIGGTAIRAENVTNVTIRDVQLRTWKTGIRFRNISDADIQIRAYDHAGPDVVDSEGIVFHDSVLRTAGTNFEADDVVVRRNDIDMDSEGSGDIQTVRDGVRVVGEDGEIVNNTIDTVPQIDPPTPTGVVIEGNRTRVRGNLIVGEYPTRRNPDPNEGIAFRVQGNDNTFSNNVIPWTGPASEIRGSDNTFVDNKVNNTYLDVSGRDNEVASVVDGDGVRLSITGTGSTVTGSRLDQITLGDNASAVRNTVTSVRSRGTDVTLAGNTVGDAIRLDGVTNGSLRNNSVGTLIRLEGTNDNALRNDTAGRVVLVDSRNNSLRELVAGNISLESISDNNTVAGSTADRIRVADDSRNNTLRGNDASIRIAGATSFDNRIVGNDASGSDVGIELNRSSRTLVLNNTVGNNDRGIVLVGASDNRLVNNTAVDNDGSAYVSRSGAVNNTVTNLTIGPTVSFRSRDIALETEASPPEPPSGLTDVGVFIDATNTSTDSWLNLTTRYSESDAGTVEEETLRLWSYDGSWTEVRGFNLVDPVDNTVSGNASGEAFGVLAPLGNATDTTPPTISDYGTRTPGDGTLVVEFDSTERLAQVSTVVTNASGAEVARLNGSDFAESGDSPYTYTGTVDLPNGTYTATLETAADGAGNDGASGQSDTATIGRAVVQLALTANRTTVDPGDAIGFTVTRADTGDRVNATIVADGRSTVTGADGQANVSFPDPGTFDVTATVAETATETFRNDTVEVTVRSTTTDRAQIAVAPASETVSAGESFRVAVTYDATAADEVYGVQFTLEYDTSALTATNVTKGPYLGTEADTLVFNDSIDDDLGRVKYGESRRIDGGVSGNGTLAYVEFTAVDQFDGTGTQTNVSFTDVGASDPDARRIETTRRNGSIRIERNRPPALSAALSSTINNVDSPMYIGIHASDDGQVRDVRLLAPNGTETDTLSCNSAECNGTVSDTPTNDSWNDSAGEYERVSYRIVATDDGGTTTTEIVRTEVYIAGDANGDGVVDIIDAVEVGRSWMCTGADSCYSDAADLNNDGVVDIFDAVLIGRNWQETTEA